MEKYCVVLENNNNEIVEVFSTHQKAEEYMDNLDRCYKSNTDEIISRKVEKTTIGNHDFITVSGTPYKMLP